MKNTRTLCCSFLLVALLSGMLSARTAAAHKPALETSQGKTIGIAVDAADGTYTIFDPVSKKPILHSRVAAEIDHHWVNSSDYLQHTVSRESVTDGFGPGTQLTITNTGLRGQPDLIYFLQLHANPDFVTIAVRVRNSGSSPITVQAFRSVEALGPAIADLGGPDASDRILSDSFSEDRPNMAIHNLADVPNEMHLAVGSQLIYNLGTKRSVFLAALTSDKFLTILRLHVAKDHISSYEVDSAGTTELTKENSLKTSPSEDKIELSLPVAPGAELSSERLLISTGTDYHQQLEDYGNLIRKSHPARVSAPTPIGWWSWTAYYFGLNEGAALTNAQFQAAHLKEFGYDFFHLDEGYQYARGEYATPDATNFPHGMKAPENTIRSLGLTPGIWTSPFQVSHRAWVYENHKDWLVHNGAGEPIPAGSVQGNAEDEASDPLYVLDATNPGAQQYLRETYGTLVRDWGIRYIKLDFMEDSAIEGYYFRPHTTALEAQRIGLQTIRDAVGEDVLLDKDGSPMLNPVGIVDMGRTSADTGHTFGASKEAAPGIAARYYMNRNFYVVDPDAFTVSRQTLEEEASQEAKESLTLDEAKVSIAVSAISGGMFELGDDMPSLLLDADRMALVQNRELINIARYGRAAKPLDLMSYAPEDEMPSVFLLRESPRQSVLTLFNWTDKRRQHRILFSDLGLNLGGHNQVVDIFDAKKAMAENQDSLILELAPHSVRMLKIVDTSIPATAPIVSAQVPGLAEVSKAAEFAAQASSGVAVLSYRWDFGDGTSSEGAHAFHTYTHDGNFAVRLTADGVEGMPFEKTYTVAVSGKIDTDFSPSRKKRFGKMR